MVVISAHWVHKTHKPGTLERLTLTFNVLACVTFFGHWAIVVPNHTYVHMTLGVECITASLVQVFDEPAGKTTTFSSCTARSPLVALDSYRHCWRFTDTIFATLLAWLMRHNWFNLPTFLLYILHTMYKLPVTTWLFDFEKKKKRVQIFTSHFQ
jgi:hypothetical protein